jgi:AcrR family transcriptional regulator
LRQKKIPRDSTKADAKAEVGSSAGYAKGQAKREEILIGVMNALSRGELRNPPLRAIGQALGVEPAHILYYFGSREELMQAVIVRWDEDSEDDGFDLDKYITIIGRNVTKPGIIHLYLAFAAEAVEPSHPAHDFIRQRFDRVNKSIAEAIRGEQEAGTISAKIDAEIEARLLIALADGLQLQSLIDPGIDAVAHIASAIGQLRTGG